MKNIFISGILLSFLLFCINLKAQEYERVWGTYFGPAGTNTQGLATPKGIMFDSQNNMFVNTLLYQSSTNPTSYYNQFLVGTGHAYTLQQGNYGIDFGITTSGNPILFGYNFLTNLSSNAVTEYLVGIDNQDNRLYIYRSLPSTALLPTSGTWLQTNPLQNAKNMLVKKTPNGNIILVELFAG